MLMCILIKNPAMAFSASTGDAILQILFIIKPLSQPSKGLLQPIPNMDISSFRIVRAHTNFRKFTYLLLAIALPLPIKGLIFRELSYILYLYIHL